MGIARPTARDQVAISHDEARRQVVFRISAEAPRPGQKLPALLRDLLLHRGTFVGAVVVAHPKLGEPNRRVFHEGGEGRHPLASEDARPCRQDDTVANCPDGFAAFREIADEALERLVFQVRLHVGAVPAWQQKAVKVLDLQVLVRHEVVKRAGLDQLLVGGPAVGVGAKAPLEEIQTLAIDHDGVRLRGSSFLASWRGSDNLDALLAEHLPCHSRLRGVVALLR